MVTSMHMRLFLRSGMAAQMIWGALLVAQSPPAVNRSRAELTQQQLKDVPQITRGKGDQERHYFFAEAEAEIPYRIYVPASYDGKTQLPMIVMLHGAGLDQDGPFTQASGSLVKLAEQHGYIIVSPLGYRKSGGYGQRYKIVVNGKEIPIDGPYPPGTKIPSDAEQNWIAELSELDVMHVVELTAAEYQVDRSRIYLSGHSMGGLGVWYLGEKYNTMWAGIAPMAAAIILPGYPFERLRNMPFMLSQGTGDVLSKTENARAVIASMKNIGLDPMYLEFEGASHGTTYDLSLSGMFNFFDRHQRGVR